MKESHCVVEKKLLEEAIAKIIISKIVTESVMEAAVQVTEELRKKEGNDRAEVEENVRRLDQGHEVSSNSLIEDPGGSSFMEKKNMTMNLSRQREDSKRCKPDETKGEGKSEVSHIK